MTTKTPHRAGAKAIPIRSDKHVGVIKAASSTADVELIDGNRWLWVTTAEAQPLVDALATYASESAMYDARLATGTLVAIRALYPSVTEEKNSINNTVVTALNQLVADGKVKSWSSSLRSDGNLDLIVVRNNGTEYTGTRRNVIEEFDIERPKSAPAERNGNGLTKTDQAKADKVQGMKDERAAVKEWETAGGDLSGKTKPATPVTDKANADLKAKQDKERTDREAKAAAGAKTATVKAPKGKTAAQSRPRPKTETAGKSRTRQPSTKSLASVLP